MKKVLSVLAFVLVTASAFGKEIPPSPDTYIHNEGVLSENGAKAVSRQLEAFEKATGHQMAVAAFQSLDGANLEDYTNRLFKAWKIGSKKNDGLLFAMYKGDRKWRVEVGYGFEGQLPDMEAYSIATEAAVPSFKRGDFDGGVLNVVKALQSRVIAGPAPAPVVHAQRVASQEDDTLAFLFWLFIGALVLGFLLWLATRDSTGGWDFDSGTTPSSRKKSRRSSSDSSFWTGYTLGSLGSSSDSSPSKSRSSDSGGSSWSGWGSGGSSGGDSGWGGGFSGGGGDSGGGGASGGW